jgi:hypothetical protein
MKPESLREMLKNSTVLVQKKAMFDAFVRDILPSIMANFPPGTYIIRKIFTASE